MNRNPNWTEEELKMAINVYCKIPFKSTRKSSPEIIRWAKIIGRSPGALYTKICNLGHFDKSMQEVGIGGLSHAGKLDAEVWAEFENNPEAVIYESEKLIADRMGRNLEAEVVEESLKLPEGQTKEVVVRRRVNQKFFREAVLTAYDNKCCITGLATPSLLEACHISSWKDDIQNRTNPKNGLCMTVTFHRAYDKYLMAITPDYSIIVSNQLIDETKDEDFRTYLLGLHGRKIHMPDKFLPAKEFLAIHYDEYKRCT